MCDKKEIECKYGYPKAVNDLAESYLQNEIFKCDTLLIDDLLNSAYQIFDSGLSKEFAVENIDNFLDTSPEAIEEFLSCNATDDSWAELSFDEKELLAEQLGFDPQPNEIYEWWAVSKWLAEKLSEYYHPVLTNAYGQWWGRTCTGQAIILDGTLQKIAGEYC